MAEDFKVKIEADLDTAQADEKIEKLVNKKRTIKLDVDINGQNAKSITDNIQKGLSKTKLDFRGGTNGEGGNYDSFAQRYG